MLTPRVRTVWLMVTLLGGLPRCSPAADRAEPPVFSSDEQALFPADGRRLLVGPRPQFVPAPNANNPPGDAPSSKPGAEDAWSRVISAEIVEGEIKRQANRIERLVRSSNDFRAGGHRECRTAFSVLAVMFAIASEHDEEVRWQEKAAGHAVAMAQAAANCKVSTDGSYREAVARSEDLATLLRGGRLPASGDLPDDWSQLAGRGPLMQRMEQALEENLSPLTASKRALSRGSEDAMHESQVLAALMVALLRPDQPDAGDDDYAGFANDLSDASLKVSRAAEQEDYESARQAVGQAGQACSRCHENYRG